jgi:flavin-dependent dehydrogenase
MVRPARVVPRRILDARIVEAATAAGAQLRRGTVRSVTATGELVRVSGDLPGGDVLARAVIGADGANGVVGRNVGVAGRRPGQVAIAIRGYAPVRADLAAEQRIVFGPGRWPAYAWSFPVGDGTANVGYGEVASPGRSLTRRHLLCGLDDLLPGASTAGRSWRAHHLPLSSGRPRQPDGRVLLVGDALSLINPITGEGIYYAVLSGLLAGRAAVSGVPDAAAAYRHALAAELGRHLRHTSVAARLAEMPGVVGAGLVAARRDQRVFDSVVELGLGRGLLTGRTLAGIGWALLTRGR